MKKNLLFISLFFITQVKAQTDVYHPFSDSSALWNETSYVQCCGALVFQPQMEIFGGDTIISNIHYQKVIASGYKTASGSGSTCCNFINQYLGAMRQDTVNKKVYFISASNSNDTLLYDFKLQVGDTLLPSYINQTNSNYVSKIDSILIGNSYRKQYYLSRILCCGNSPSFGDTNYVSIIEGIGSTFGLLYQLAPPFEAGSTLNCFSQNHITLYPSLNDSCSSTVSINKLKSSETAINLFPNPAQNTITIETTNTEKQTLQLFDVNGKLVLTQIIDGTTSIDVRSLSQGVYNANLSSTWAIINKRLVIIK